MYKIKIMKIFETAEIGTFYLKNSILLLTVKTKTTIHLNISE